MALTKHRFLIMNYGRRGEACIVKGISDVGACESIRTRLESQLNAIISKFKGVPDIDVEKASLYIDGYLVYVTVGALEQSEAYRVVADVIPEYKCDIRWLPTYT